MTLQPFPIEESDVAVEFGGEAGVGVSWRTLLSADGTRTRELSGGVRQIRPGAP